MHSPYKWLETGKFVPTINILSHNEILPLKGPEAMSSELSQVHLTMLDQMRDIFSHLVGLNVIYPVSSYYTCNDALDDLIV
jgi:hypothetical protein